MAKYAGIRQLTRLRPGVGWWVRAGARERPLDARVLLLLGELAGTPTLVAAARSAGIPYRTAWAVIEDASQAIGAPLVDLVRGRGAKLTPLGHRLLAAHQAALRATAGVEPLEVQGAGPVRPAEPPAPLRVAASHDIALAQLRDRWRLAHGVQLEFHGSGESLDAYRSGTAEVAGFHVEQGARRDADPLLARIDARRDALVSFMTRTQGLIVAKGNPRRVRTLGQAAARGLAFVNRQPGSGTRLLLDRLLAREGIAAAGLRGYTHEEFTHAAVAATIAAGRADVALGIEAAAAQFGLSFVPLVHERYCFVVRRSALRTARVRAFRTLLASPATAAVIAPLPGYTLERPGELIG
ncbi:MAG TPA: substrate-binding domain-containing protein [Casimicrobiaceae bacterium]|nr:substrate-binding domain-containing protein [Casimicrobiaceae bacterium]